MLLSVKVQPYQQGHTIFSTFAYIYAHLLESLPYLIRTCIMNIAQLHLSWPTDCCIGSTYVMFCIEMHTAEVFMSFSKTL